MAIYVRDGSTDYVVTKRSTFTTNTAGVTTIARITDTFTAPNTTDKAMGLVVWIALNNNQSNGSVFTATLQENTGSGFVDTPLVITATVDHNVSETPLRFHDSTGYTFTTTTANRYRWSIIRVSGTGFISLLGISANVPAAWFYDSRTGTPGDGDELVVAGRNWETPTTFTLTNGLTIGNFGSNNVIMRPDQNTSPAITIGYNGIVEPDTGNVSIISKGVIGVVSGHLKLGGTEASPRTTEFNIAFNNNNVDGNYGIVTRNVDSTPDNSAGVITGYFNDGRARHGQVVSGSGTTGSPLRVSGISGWAIDDPLAIEQTAAIAQNEYRFIRTITLVSGNTYDITLSSTAGGAEAGLTHTHDSTARVYNRYRLCTINSTNQLHHWWFYFNNSAGDNRFDGLRFRDLGIASGLGKTGFTLPQTNRLTLLKDLVFEDFNVAVTINNAGATQTNFSGITLFVNGESNSRAVNAAGSNASFENLVGMDVGFDALLIVNGANFQIDEFRAFNCGRDNPSTAAFRTSGAQKVTINNVYFQGNRAGYNGNSGVAIEGTNVEIGNKIANTIADIIVNSTYHDIMFRNASLGSSTQISGTALMLAGSSIGLTNLNGTEYADFTYYPNSTVQRTGAGLADTITKTTGNYATRLAPFSITDPSVIEYRQPVEENKTIIAFGYVRTNTAFNNDADSSARVRLFLPGSTVADVTYTVLKNTTDWQLFTLSAVYTGTLDSEATIRVSGLANDAGAYLYFADPLEGTNDYTSQRIWFDALPSPVMPATLGDPVSNAIALLQTVYAPFTGAGNVAEALGNANAPTAQEVADAVDVNQKLPNLLIKDKLS